MPNNPNDGGNITISSDSEYTIDHLIQQQAGLIRSISRCVDNLRKMGQTKWTLPILRGRMTTLTTNWESFRRNHALIEQNATAEDRQLDYFITETYDLTEDSFLEAQDFINEKTASLELAPLMHAPVIVPQQQVMPNATVKLPRIELPSFTGNYADWQNFHDLFESLVHTNTSLSRVQKLHYLKSSLIGEAATLLKNLQVTDANYTTAWTSVKSRYNNKRAIITAHLHAFYGVPAVTTDVLSGLKSLRDTTTEVRTALTNLGQPVGQWDTWMVFYVVQKLDKQSRTDWETSLGDSTEYPSYDTLERFLDTRIRTLEALATSFTLNEGSKKFESKSTKQGSFGSKFVKSHLASSGFKCYVCEQNHPIYTCPQFRGYNAAQRESFAHENKLCINCLVKGHSERDCKSQYRCKQCRKRHHTLLHVRSNAPVTQSLQANVDNSYVNVEETSTTAHTAISTLSAHSNQNSQSVIPETKIILATAWIKVTADSGQFIRVRALLDQGSESTFISEALTQALRLPRRRVYATVQGLGGTKTNTIRSSTSFNIEPCHGRGPVIPATALVLQKITSYVPKRITQLAEYEHLKNLEFADPVPYDNHSIDVLLGADLYGTILRNGLCQGPPGSPTAQLTIFGWVLSGPASPSAASIAKLHVHHCTNVDEVNNVLRRFWEIEELPPVKYPTADEQQCDDHFVSTHTRADDRKYVLRLPFKQPPPIDIGDTKQIAMACYSRLETRLRSNPEQSQAYHEFLTEYEALGHMKLVNDTTDANTQYVYLPHHPVVREDSSTTRLRVVFNASCVSSNGTSLNSHMFTGPKLQADIRTVILNWRMPQYVFTADIAKMYRQIWIDPRDQSYQCILWRSPSSEQINTYKLTTVTYGTISAPYLAMRVLKQLVQDDGARFPLAVPVLSDNIYVDDVMFGADNKDLALETRNHVSQLLASAGFVLRKWASNSPDLLADVPKEDHGLAMGHPLQEDDSLKVLGVLWNPLDDTFRVKITAKPLPVITKRIVLAVTAQAFDPLGWVAPVIIRAKILMQYLWTLKADWDEPLPPDALTRWEAYYSQLPLLENLQLPRWTAYTGSTSTCELHGFADASSQAYAAVVYVRIITDSGEIRTTLLISKSKVAPLKTVSIPRLELCAATLLSRLIEYVQLSMHLVDLPTYCWTDSTVTLGWIRKHPSTWKVFIANRVAEIHTRVPNASWKHVPTEQNPADCASRGMSAPEFLRHSLWLSGPAWLNETPANWPNQTFLNDFSTNLESKSKVQAHHGKLKTEWELASRYSSWAKLLRVTAYIFRYVNNTRARIVKRKRGESPEYNHDVSLCTEELNHALHFWVKSLQKDAFRPEITALTAKTVLPSSSPLTRLDPQLDEFGIVRVGGRLQQSSLPYGTKHPVILPKHQLSDLIVAQIHANTLHGGTQLTLRVLRQQYWILGARNVVKSVIHNCIKCARHKGMTGQQFLANLPDFRVTPSRPFSHTGIDYAGPLLVRTTAGRGHRSHKAYVALFVCLATRAIHIKLVSDYSTDTFLAALYRFVCRRGIPSDLYSDNGTNFQGAEKELASAIKAVTTNSDVRNRIASDGISWHFIPPASPHFGGIWEAGVKSVKHHLRRVLGSCTPTAEEMITLLCQIEACLNSRPIAPLRDDIESFDALTPGHFLIGTSMKTVPQPSLLDVNENRLSRWQLVRKMVEQFWREWKNEYLHSLQQRFKWKTRQINLKPGELVLIKNDNLPPCKWQLGRIVECHYGQDRLVRVVTVKTAQSQYTRPITKICKLPIKSSE